MSNPEEIVDASQGKPKIPASIAQKNREELQWFVVDLLKRLKERDKQIASLSTKASDATAPSNAELQEHLQEAQQQLFRYATKIEELQTQQSSFRDMSKQLQEATEKESMFQQQIGSLKEALRSMADEREEAFTRLGEEKEKVSELQDALHNSEQHAQRLSSKLKTASSELESTKQEAEQFRAQLAELNSRNKGSDSAGRVAELEAQLASSTTELEVVRAKLASSTAELESVSQQLAGAQQRLIAVEAEQTGPGPAPVQLELVSELEAKVTALEAEMASSRSETANWVPELELKRGEATYECQQLEGQKAPTVSAVDVAPVQHEAPGVAGASQEGETEGNMATEVGTSGGGHTSEEVSQSGKDGISMLRSAKARIEALEHQLHSTQNSSKELEKARVRIAALESDLAVEKSSTKKMDQLAKQMNQMASALQLGSVPLGVPARPRLVRGNSVRMRVEKLEQQFEFVKEKFQKRKDEGPRKPPAPLIQSPGRLTHCPSNSTISRHLLAQNPSVPTSGSQPTTPLQLTHSTTPSSPQASLSPQAKPHANCSAASNSVTESAGFPPGFQCDPGGMSDSGSVLRDSMDVDDGGHSTYRSLFHGSSVDGDDNRELQDGDGSRRSLDETPFMHASMDEEHGIDEDGGMGFSARSVRISMGELSHSEFDDELTRLSQRVAELENTNETLMMLCDQTSSELQVKLQLLAARDARIQELDATLKELRLQLEGAKSVELQSRRRSHDSEAASDSTHSLPLTPTLSQLSRSQLEEQVHVLRQQLHHDGHELTGADTSLRGELQDMGRRLEESMAHAAVGDVELLAARVLQEKTEEKVEALELQLSLMEQHCSRVTTQLEAQEQKLNTVANDLGSSLIEAAAVNLKLKQAEVMAGQQQAVLEETQQRLLAVTASLKSRQAALVRVQKELDAAVAGAALFNQEVLMEVGVVDGGKSERQEQLKGALLRWQELSGQLHVHEAEVLCLQDDLATAAAEAEVVEERVKKTVAEVRRVGTPTSSQDSAFAILPPHIRQAIYSILEWRGQDDSTVGDEDEEEGERSVTEQDVSIELPLPHPPAVHICFNTTHPLAPPESDLSAPPIHAEANVATPIKPSIPIAPQTHSRHASPSPARRAPEAPSAEKLALLTSQLEAAVKERDQLQIQLAELSVESERQAHLLEEVESKCHLAVAALQGQMEELNRHWEAAQGEQSKLQEQLDELHGAKSKLDAELEEAQGAKFRLGSELEAAQGEKHKLQEHLDELQELKIRLEAELEESQERKSKLEAELQELLGAKFKVDAELEGVQRDRSKLEVELQQMHGLRYNLDAELEDAQRHKTKLESDLQDVQGTKSNLEAELEQVQRDKSRLETDLHAVQDDIQKELMGVKADKQKLQAQLVELNEAVGKLEEALSEAHGQGEKLCTEVSELKASSSKLEVELSEMRREHVGVVAKYREVELLLEAARGNNSELKAELQLQKGLAEQEKARLEASLLETGDMSAHQQQLLQEANHKLQVALAKLESEVQQLAQATTELHSKTEAHDQLQEHVAQVKEQLSAAISRLDGELAAKEELQSRLANMRKRVGELERGEAEWNEKVLGLSKQLEASSSLQREMEARLVSLQTSGTENEEQLAEAAKQLEEAKGKLLVLQERASQAEGLLEQMKRESGLHSTMVVQAAQERVQLSQQLQQACTEKAELEQTLVNLEREMKEQIVKMEREVEEQKQLRSQTEASRGALEGSYKVREQQHQEASQKVEELEKQLQEASQKVEELEKQLQEASQQVEGLELMLQVASQKMAEHELQQPLASVLEDGAEKAAEANSSERIKALEAETQALRTEISENKKKFVSVAKKKQGEYTAKIAKLEHEVAQLKPQVLEVVQLREQLERLSLELAESSAKSLADIDEKAAQVSGLQTALSQKESHIRSLNSKLEAETAKVADLSSQVSHLQQALTSEQAKLRRKDLECESLNMELKRAEGEAEAAQKELAGMDLGASAEVERLASSLKAARQEVETAQKEVQSVREEVAAKEADRQKALKLLDGLKKRLDKAVKDKTAAEDKVAELQSRAEEAQASCMEATQQLLVASQDRSKLELEMREYRGRAQMLLKAKERELQSVREATGADNEPNHGLEEAQARVTELQQLLETSASSLDALRKQHAEEVFELQCKLAIQTAQLTENLEFTEASLQQVKSEYEELRVKHNALEMRLQRQDSSSTNWLLASSVKAAEEGKLELEAAQLSIQTLQQQLKELEANYRSFRITSDSMMEAKDGEVLLLLRKNALLQEELSAVRRRASLSAGSNPDTPVSQLLAGFTRQASQSDSLPPITPAPPLPKQASPPPPALATPLPPSPSHTIGAASELGPRHWRRSSQSELLEGIINTQSTPPSAVACKADQQAGAESSMGSPALLTSADERELMNLAARQAERDDALAVLLARNKELEGEVADLMKEVQLREEMEAALKEEIREWERSEKRKDTSEQSVDMEYLKNTVVKLIETGQVEALLPVLTTLLSLSPSEVERCKDAVSRAMVDTSQVPLSTAAAVVDTSVSIVSSLSDWTAWALGGTTNTAASTPSARMSTISARIPTPNRRSSSYS